MTDFQEFLELVIGLTILFVTLRTNTTNNKIKINSS